MVTMSRKGRRKLRAGRSSYFRESFSWFGGDEKGKKGKTDFCSGFTFEEGFGHWDVEVFRAVMFWVVRARHCVEDGGRPLKTNDGGFEKFTGSREKQMYRKRKLRV